MIYLPRLGSLCCDCVASTILADGVNISLTIVYTISYKVAPIQ